MASFFCDKLVSPITWDIGGLGILLERRKHRQVVHAGKHHGKENQIRNAAPGQLQALLTAFVSGNHNSSLNLYSEQNYGAGLGGTRAKCRDAAGFNLLK